MLTDSTHSYCHAERVWHYSRKIAEKEGGDFDVLFASSFLHDITYSEGREGHEISGAALACKILSGIGFPQEKIGHVRDCIRNHRFSKDVEPKTTEEKIMQDADRLDAMGARGIARCFLWTGKHGTGMKEAVEHFDEKLLKLKDKMKTDEGRKIAERKHEYMELFLKEMGEFDVRDSYRGRFGGQGQVRE